MKYLNRKELLEDLYSGDGGPAVERILESVRRDRWERARRKAAVGVTAAVAICASAALTVFWKSPTAAPPPPVPAIARQAPDTVDRISDEELLAAVGGPAAIKTLPDGRQSVLYFAPGTR